jgi:hypothetical protein
MVDRRFPGARRRAVDLLTTTAARVAGRGPVIVPEYELDPRAATGGTATRRWVRSASCSTSGWRRGVIA